MRNLNLPILLAAALNCVPCLAATPTSAAKTREFHEAYAAANSKDLARAYKILTALVAKNPAYDAVGFLGQTELSLGKYRDASEHLAFAIQNTPPEKADAITVLIADLAEAKAHITTLRITIDQPDAEVSLDGKVLPKSSLDSELFVEPGKHLISAIHPTLGSTESPIDGKAGESSVVALKLAKPASSTVPPPNTAASSAPPALKYTPADLDKPSQIAVNEPPPVETKRGVEPRTIVLIAGGAVTLIAAGTATYFGLKARSAGDDADKLRADAQKQFGTNPCSSPAGQGSGVCADMRDKWDKHNSAGRIYNVALPVAGVAAIATGVLYVVLPSHKHATSQNLTLVPVADQRASGFLLQGSF